MTGPDAVLGLAAATLLLAGCTSGSTAWMCETPAQADAQRAAELVPVFRGNDAVIGQLSAATDGKHRVLAATIEGATANGEHAGSEPDVATWIAYGDSISEVTQAWDGQLRDGSAIDWATARQVVLGCLAGGR